MNTYLSANPRIPVEVKTSIESLVREVSDDDERFTKYSDVAFHFFQHRSTIYENLEPEQATLLDVVISFIQFAAVSSAVNRRGELPDQE